MLRSTILATVFMFTMAISSLSPGFAQSTDVAPSTTSGGSLPTAQQQGEIKRPGKSSIAVSDVGRSLPNTFKTPWEVWLTLLTAAMMGIAILVLSIVGWKANFSADFQRTFLIVIIIFASLYLIVAGYSDQQIAPVFSLFGAVVGYLFGKSDSRPSESGPSRTSPPGPVTTPEPKEVPKPSPETRSPVQVAPPEPPQPPMDTNPKPTEE